MKENDAAPAWQWSRTAKTRRTLLEAASQVFAERGFSDAAVTDVVSRAGSSVGSMYHHFGGKTELFMALWEEHQAAQEESASTAVSNAKAGGTTDPIELFEVGARAYLAGVWEYRDLARVFLDGDGPPGFEVMRRTRGREWVRQNAVLLGAGASASERLYVAVLTAIIAEAAREVITSDNAEQAAELTDGAIELIRRLDRPVQAR